MEVVLHTMVQYAMVVCRGLAELGARPCTGVVSAVWPRKRRPLLYKQVYENTPPSLYRYLSVRLPTANTQDYIKHTPWDDLFTKLIFLDNAGRRVKTPPPYTIDSRRFRRLPPPQKNDSDRIVFALEQCYIVLWTQLRHQYPHWCTRSKTNRFITLLEYTAVQFWGQTTWNLTGISPSLGTAVHTKRVKAISNREIRPGKSFFLR